MMENRRQKNGGVVRENHPVLGETSAMEHVGFPVANRKKMFRLLHWEYHLVGGWALPLWKMMEFVSWDDDILNINGKSFTNHVPNHQPDHGLSHS